MIAATARRSPRRRSPSNAGYTAMELLMAIAVLTVGVIGVASMQKVTVASNAHAKNLSIATHIGQGWLGMLEAEATLWDASPLSINRTTWLKTIPGDASWFRPPFIPALRFGPEFDALGNPVISNGVYCVDLRLSRLNGDDAELEGIGVWRSEVRVYWLREEQVPTATLTPPASPCNLLPDKVSLQPESRLMHFVYLSGAVRQVVP